ncbi:MAG TPA: ImcF-related family protein [Longimicrobiales bacterium]|nr:ImcF-related family protein [Longimicrobiales bacterium]
MRPRPMSLGITGAVFAGTVLLGLMLAGLLPLSGAERWILRGLMIVVAAVAAFVVYRLLPKASAGQGAGAQGDDVADALDQAQRRLAASSAATSRVAHLPTVLIVGPAGSAKTTSVARAGLESELVAGETYRQEVVVPTPALNVWYARGTLLVEAGGGLLGDAARWSRLAQQLKPARWRAAVAGQAQAPRSVVVCFSCEELLRPGASEAVPAAARQLRQRLQELAQRFGVRLPVYVLFTKADRLPYFEDYVRNLTEPEAGQVLGVTLPVPPAGAGGTYAATIAEALGRTFGTVTRSLARARLEQLGRETREEVKAGIYEFPREFGKLSTLTIEFLVELCRPSQLAVSPFLRGYYFTGVRAVVVSDPGRRAAAPSPGASAMGATMVFDAAARAAAPPPPSSQGGRKVPQWLFLEPFFRRVVLRDPVAETITSGGHGVNLMRRGLLAAAAGLALLMATGFTTSHVANRRVQRDAVVALRGVAPVPVLQGGLPSAAELRSLDALREELTRVSRYEREGRPLRLRWGLYAGSAVQPTLRRVYFDRFDRLLGGEARTALNQHLRRIPAAPDETSDYSAAYDALKAHLVTTSDPQRSSGEFLGPALTSHWLQGRTTEPEMTELAARQFAFYGDELPHGNPYALRADDATVTRVRSYLSRFQETERLYRALVTQASAESQPVRFADQHPGSARVIQASHAVPGAYTVSGWALIQRYLGDVETLFTREEWVTGGSSFSGADLGRMEQALRDRYVADYIDQWRGFLAGAALVRFGGAADAAAKLADLAGNESPLLQLLRLVSQHTAVDSVLVTPAFQPVHAVMPPVTDRYITETNKPYMDALGQLQASLAMASSSTGPMRSDGLSQAMAAVGQGKGAVRQLAQGFVVRGRAQDVGNRVRDLMETPLQQAEVLIGYLPSAEVNQHGQRFCAAWNAVARSYPFSLGSRAEAALDDVSALLKPGESALSSLHDQALRDLVVPQGSGYAARLGASPQPTRAFLQFFNRMNGVANALYRDGVGPVVDFSLRFETSAQLPEVTFSMDGRTHTFTRNFPAAQTFRWEGARAQTAVVRGKIGGAETTLVEAPSGTWALHRLLQSAQWRRVGEGRYTLEWPVRGQQITLQAQLVLSSAVPVLSAGYLSELTCVSTIASR